MPSKKIIPRTAAAARRGGARKARRVNHSNLPANEKKKWALVRQAPAATAQAHMVCYFNPRTGLWDDCHWVS
jgi:hypothetical protein